LFLSCNPNFRFFLFTILIIQSFLLPYPRSHSPTVTVSIQLLSYSNLLFPCKHLQPASFQYIQVACRLWHSKWSRLRLKQTSVILRLAEKRYIRVFYQLQCHKPGQITVKKSLKHSDWQKCDTCVFSASYCVTNRARLRL